MMKMGMLLLAGSLFFNLSAGRVKRGVTVDGMDVGGMPQKQAVELLRAHHVRESLFINAPTGSFFAPLDYRDDAEQVVRRARAGEHVFVTWRREWPTLEEDLLALCRQNARDGVNATLCVQADGFTYRAGKNAVVCDYARLVEDAVHALRFGGREISLSVFEQPPPETVETLKGRTRPLAAFSTRYSEENAPRSHNIALATRLLSGTEVGAGETFSFNAKVGERTKERGFSEAPVIVGGEFVQGVGGGVCQVSTTLFGAALRAGLEVVESHPHSLTVGYVSPSEDAMVSAASDLKLKNPHPYPVYFFGSAREGEVSFTVCGKPDGRTYRVESRVLFTLDPPAPQVVAGEEDEVVRAERQGLASESYLLVYRDGKILSRTLLRRDTYACVQGILRRKNPEADAKDGANLPQNA